MSLINTSRNCSKIGIKELLCIVESSKFKVREEVFQMGYFRPKSPNLSMERSTSLCSQHSIDFNGNKQFVVVADLYASWTEEETNLVLTDVSFKLDCVSKLFSASSNTTST